MTFGSQIPFDVTASGKLTASDPSGKTGGPTLILSQPVTLGETTPHGPSRPFAHFGRPALLNKPAYNPDIEAARAKIVTLEGIVASAEG